MHQKTVWAYVWDTSRDQHKSQEPPVLLIPKSLKRPKSQPVRSKHAAGEQICACYGSIYCSQVFQSQITDSPCRPIGPERVALSQHTMASLTQAFAVLPKINFIAHAPALMEWHQARVSERSLVVDKKLLNAFYHMIKNLCLINAGNRAWHMCQQLDALCSLL